MHSIKEGQLPRIEIHSLRDGTHQVIEGVTSFQMSPDLEHFVYAQQIGNFQHIGMVTFGKRLLLPLYQIVKRKVFIIIFNGQKKKHWSCFSPNAKMGTIDEEEVCLVDVAKKNFCFFLKGFLQITQLAEKFCLNLLNACIFLDDLSKVYFAYEHEKKASGTTSSLT